MSKEYDGLLATLAEPLFVGEDPLPVAREKLESVHGHPLLGSISTSCPTSEELLAVQLIPDGSEAFNPAFDVTPADYIDGIITEVGVAEKDESGKFNLAEVFER